VWLAVLIKQFRTNVAERLGVVVTYPTGLSTVQPHSLAPFPILLLLRFVAARSLYCKFRM
jgi:hypothetical protein